MIEEGKEQETENRVQPTNQNEVVLQGRLVKDPLEKTVGKGLVKEFSIAQNPGQRSQYFDCVVWDDAAERLSAKKGDLVQIEGSLQQDRWADKATGATRSRVRIRAERIEIIQSQRETQSQDPKESPENAHDDPDQDLSIKI